MIPIFLFTTLVIFTCKAYLLALREIAHNQIVFFPLFYRDEGEMNATVQK